MTTMSRNERRKRLQTVSNIKVPPQVPLMNLPFDAANVVIDKAAGGVLPLRAAQVRPGLYTTAWSLNDYAMALIMHRHAALTVVIDMTTVDADHPHPAISVVVQEVDVVPDGITHAEPKGAQ